MSTNTAGTVAPQGPSQENVPDGYPALAAFQTNALNTAVFRRFRTINTLNLLHLQTEMFQLEDDIQRRWAADTKAAKTAEQTRTYKSFAQLVRNSKKDEDMKDLLSRLRGLTKEYNEALLLYDGAMGLESPRKRPVDVLKRWLKHNDYPLIDAGRGFLDPTREHSAEDLVALGSERHKKDILTSFIYKHCAGWKILRDKENSTLKVDLDLELGSDKEPKASIIFFSEKRVEVLIIVVKLILAMVLLFGAVVWLYFTKPQGVKLALVGGFTVVFCMTMLATTTASSGEVFAGTAAYCALLVVFISGNIASD